MKKNNLFLVVFLLLVATLSAQVNFNVLTPSSLANSYQFTYAKPIDAWSTPDMTDTANAITGQLVFVDDGTIADSLGCDSLVNGTQVNGNIAVVYRGSCQFGTKALRAQNAGAIGVIIINNTAGIFNMFGGNDGINVTIPTIMISQADGMLLRNDILQNNVTAFLGSKIGKFANDVGAYKKDIVQKQYYAEPTIFQFAFSSSVNVPFGLWVRNFGNQNQTNVLVSVNLIKNGNILFSNSSTINSLNSGDSIFVSLGSYGISLSNGLHSIIYTITPQNADEDNLDNTLVANFNMTDGVGNYILSYASVDSITLKPQSNSFLFTADEVCIAYTPPQSLMFDVVATGLTFPAFSADTYSITGKSVTTYVYEWGDYFTDINDPNYGFSNVSLQSMGVFNYSNNNQEGIPVFIPFINSVYIDTYFNKRYIFCVQSDNQDLMFGVDSKLDYTTNQNTFLQPLFLLKNGNSFSQLPLNYVSSISISFDILTSITDKEDINALKPFPNPANDRIEIPFYNVFDIAHLEIFDVTGKVVTTKMLRFKFDKKLSVDVSSLENGIYIFKIKLDANQTASSFKVMIQR
ncbi:MAG: hypothetical protein CO022_05960 [Flavobacteriales bacterium CG_4_9_14_0_2_um_filter_32_27]|nr:MAG: hypothetical protein CO022_05960 [Flavobacteriales bacterium CG_4_9_14_0_2_um_filter_32_27]